MGHVDSLLCWPPGSRDVRPADPGEDQRQEPGQLHQRCSSDVSPLTFLRRLFSECQLHSCRSFPSPPTCRPLHVAARKGLTVVVQELLGKGASVLAVDENGEFATDGTSCSPRGLPAQYQLHVWKLTKSLFDSSHRPPLCRLHPGALLRPQQGRGRLPGAHPQLHDAHLPHGHHRRSAGTLRGAGGRQPPPPPPCLQQPHLQGRGL